jgi:ribosome-binding factor A
MARVGEQIRRTLAAALVEFEDPRLELVSITGANVDRELHRAVVWFTTLEGDDDTEVLEAFDEHRGRLRRIVASEVRLRKTPELEFRPDTALRAAERIEDLIREMDQTDQTDQSPDAPDDT